MKIVAFLYFFPCENRVYITSLCDMLTRLGHKVDVFSFFIKDRTLTSQEHTLYSPVKSYLSIKKITDEIRTCLRRILPLFSELENNLKLYTDMQEVKKKLRKLNNYDFSIGIEKGGLICAHQLYKYYKIPFYYFSLELYAGNHHHLKKATMFKVMHKKEVIAHRKASGTIIADEDRKNFLYETSKIDFTKPAFYLPVSFDESVMLSSTSLSPSIIHNLKKKVILNFGINRLPDDFFISLIKKLPEEYLFLMHNNITTYHEKLSNENLLKGVQFSHQFLDEKEIMSMISDSFIGFSWYDDKEANDIYIAFSSEKTARYLAAGKPIIANAKTNFIKLFSLYKCGICVNSPEDAIDALQTISSDYKTYSEQAKEAFEKIYKLSNFQQPLNTFLQSNLNNQGDKP